MGEKTSNIKERVLQITEIKNIAKEKFFSDLGVSYGNFKGKSKKSDVGSAIIAEITTKFPDISPEWLLTGRGSMLKEEDKAKTFVKPSNSEECKVCKANEQTISALEKNITSQEKLIARLEQQLAYCELQNQKGFS
jgi:hypothetical protein